MDYTLSKEQIDSIWAQVAEQRKADSAQATLPEETHFEIVKSKRRSQSTITVEPNESLEPVQFTPSKSADDFNLAEFTVNATNAITAIETASEKFEADFGKPDVRLHSALKRFEAAQEELRAAEAELNAIRSEGDSVEKYLKAVNLGARAWESLFGYAKTLIGNDVILRVYGRLLPKGRRDAVVDSIAANHVRTARLDEFKTYIQPVEHSEARGSETKLKNRAAQLVGLITKLAQYVQKDHEENAQ
jgi:hypothetical protein